MLTQEGRITELAHLEAKARHPNGYSKAQLIECSKSVFGGRGRSLFLPVVTEEDINHQRNAMAFIDGRYPLGMDDCTTVGLSGGCGPSCPALLGGRCEFQEGLE